MRHGECWSQLFSLLEKNALTGLCRAATKRVSTNNHRNVQVFVPTSFAIFCALNTGSFEGALQPASWRNKMVWTSKFLLEISRHLPHWQPNLTLYTTTAFLILDSDGQRVLAKYYRPKGSPYGDLKGLTTLKEQKTFEKGLWDKTKKAGSTCQSYLLVFRPTEHSISSRWYYHIREPSSSIQALARPCLLYHRQRRRERTHVAYGA